MVNNSWGSGMAVDEMLARRIITESAGVEVTLELPLSSELIFFEEAG
jgi:hypothetical protein